MFAVFDRYGDMGPVGMGEQGIFSQGTRYLSERVVYLWDSRPLLLSSTIQADNFVFTADLANVDVGKDDEVIVPGDTLHVVRSKFLWQGACYEEFKIVNYGLAPLVIPLRLAIGADFADIFEVRGMRRERRGRRLEDQIEKNQVIWSYEGLDGEIRQTRIHCDPAPKEISGTELKFEYFLRPKETAVFHVTMVASGDPADRNHSVGYPSALAAADTELKAASENLCLISSSNNRFNDWIKRSAADVEMMTIGNREKDYPYAGVPWFSTVFGRDGIITALETLWIEPTLAQGVLKFLAQTQATELDRESEAEPGKILHELRHGEMANLREIPFGRYYGTVDATPLFVVLAGAYYERTGDRTLIEN